MQKRENRENKVNKIKISIIMPIYNTGPYLEESLQSIMQQSFNEYELICVNDASDDEETIKILNHYQAINDKIHVIGLNERSGAGNARNIGLSTAIGDYIIFLDADDIFENNMLASMYKSIIKNNSEICICGNRSFYTDENGKYDLGLHMPRTYKGITDRVFYLDELGEEALTYWSTAPWNKLCKKDFIIKNQIYFQEIASSNDVYYSCLVVLLAQKLTYTQDYIPLLSYRQNNKNQISSNREPLNLIRAIELLIRTLKARDCFETHSTKVLCFLIKNSIYEIQHCCDEERNEKYYNILKEFIQLNFPEENFINPFYHFCRNNIIKESYENRWFDIIDDFYRQLNQNTGKLIERLDEYENIILWGMGKRGTAFQKFCNDKKLPLIGVADKTNQNIGSHTEWGYEIIDLEDVFKLGTAIVASNFDIYQYLLGINNGSSVINLNEYCPY